MAELCLEPHLLTDVSQRAFGNSLKHQLKRRLKLQSCIKSQKKTETTLFSQEYTEEISSNVFFSLVACEPKGPQISSPHRDVDQ